MVVSPRYDQYKDAWDTSVLAEVIFKFFFCSISIYQFFYLCNFHSNSRNYDLVFSLKWEINMKRCGISIATKEALTASLLTIQCFLKRSSFILIFMYLYLFIYIILPMLKIIMFLSKNFQVWGKTGSKIYGPVAGTDYEDNQLRFSLLSLVSNIVFSKKKKQVSYAVEIFLCV